MKRRFILGFALIVFMATPTLAATKLSLVGAVPFGHLAQTVDSGDAALTSYKMGYGGAALVEFALGNSVGLQLGGVYLQRKTADATGTYVFPAIQIPVAFRLWLGRHLVASAGGYYAYGLQKVKSPSGSEYAYKDSGVKKGDFGVLLGLGLNLPLSQGVSFVAEGRVNYGLSDISDPAISGTTRNWISILPLVGFQFALGGK